ncbi:MAG: hypothetical protein ABJK39_11590 [Hyphomicrobiales bacterium]
MSMLRFIVPIVATLVAGAAHANDAGIAAGKKTASQHCTRCHVVGDINPKGGISSTPSFQLMVNALSDWRERFQTFHVRRPHPSVVRIEGFDYPQDPPTTVLIFLTIDDIDPLVAYAETLKKD